MTTTVPEIDHMHNLMHVVQTLVAYRNVISGDQLSPTTIGAIDGLLKLLLEELEEFVL